MYFDIYFTNYKITKITKYLKVDNENIYNDDIEIINTNLFKIDQNLEHIVRLKSEYYFDKLYFLYFIEYNKEYEYSINVLPSLELAVTLAEEIFNKSIQYYEIDFNDYVNDLNNVKKSFDQYKISILNNKEIKNIKFYTGFGIGTFRIYTYNIN